MEFTRAGNDMEARAEELLSALAASSGVDPRKGSVVRDLVITPMAVMAAAAEARIIKAGVVASLHPAVVPTLEDYAVDVLASNFRVSRKAGTRPGGALRLYLSSSTAVTLPSGTVFTLAGATATLTTSVVGYSGVSPSSGREGAPYYIPIRQVSPGVWALDIFLQLDQSSDVSITSGVEVEVSAPPRTMTSCVVVSPFTGGGADEDNATLASRAMSSGQAAVPSGTAHIKAAVADELDLVPGDVGVAGCGDAFLLRGRSPLTGVSSGGAADVYVRAAALPSEVSIPTRLVASSTGRWLGYLHPGDAAGVVSVLSVSTSDWEASGSALSTTYGVSPEGAGSRVDTPAQARLGAYQTISVEASAPLPATGEVEGVIRVGRFPGVSAAQGLFSTGGSMHSPFLDVAVKAPAPLHLSMSVKAGRALSEAERALVAAGISSRVAALPVGSSRVDASLVVDAFVEAVPDTRPVFPVIMRASGGADGGPWLSHSSCGFVEAPPDTELYHSASRVWCCGADNVKVTDG